MAKIVITETGITMILGRFKAMKEKFATIMHKPLLQAAVYLQGSVLRNFIAQGRPEPWLPHSAMTKGFRGPDARILEDTGRLKNSIMPFSGNDYFGVGTNVEYANLMQSGGMSSPAVIAIAEYTRRPKTSTGGWGANAPGVKKLYKKASGAVTVHAHTMKLNGYPVPARPFLMVQTEDIPRMAAILSDWIDRNITHG